MKMPAYVALRLLRRAAIRTDHNTTKLAANAPYPTFSICVNLFLCRIPSLQKRSAAPPMPGTQGLSFSLGPHPG